MRGHELATEESSQSRLKTQAKSPGKSHGEQHTTDVDNEDALDQLTEEVADLLVVDFDVRGQNQVLGDPIPRTAT